MFDLWMLAQVAAFGVLVLFSGYLTYRRYAKQAKRLQHRRNRAVLV